MCFVTMLIEFSQDLVAAKRNGRRPIGQHIIMTGDGRTRRGAAYGRSPHVKSNGTFFAVRAPPSPTAADPRESDPDPEPADSPPEQDDRSDRLRCRWRFRPDGRAAGLVGGGPPPLSCRCDGDGERDGAGAGGRSAAEDTDRSMGDSWTGNRSRRTAARSGDADGRRSVVDDDRDDRDAAGLLDGDRFMPRPGAGGGWPCMAARKKGAGGGNGNAGKNGDGHRSSSGRTACTTAAAAAAADTDDSRPAP